MNELVKSVVHMNVKRILKYYHSEKVLNRSYFNQPKTYSRKSFFLNIKVTFNGIKGQTSGYENLHLYIDTCKQSLDRIRFEIKKDIQDFNSLNK